MKDRGIWEEDLWTSNAQLQSRPWSDRPEVKELPRVYVVDDEPLWPWILHSLAPLDLERSWLPLPEYHEVAWVHRNGKVRCALVDYEQGLVVAWHRLAGSTAYQPRTTPP